VPPESPSAVTPAEAPSRPVVAAPSRGLSRRDFVLVTGGLALLLLVAHGRSIVGGETFVLHDHLIYTLPSRAHLVDAVARLLTLWAAAVRSGGGLRALDLFGIDYAILPASQAVGPLTPLLAAPQGDMVLAHNGQHRPRAFVAPRWRTFASDTEMLDALFAPALDRNQVRLAGPLQGPAPAAAADANAQIERCSLASARPERVRLDCRAPFAGYAVLLDAYWPGWSATVDGKPVAIERSDLMVRAVPVPAGAHTVEMTYQTPGLQAGACLSLPAWLGLIALFGLTRRRPSDVQRHAGH
jgi:hypothetical protein